MASGSDNYHEPYELLSGESRDMHRALVTVMEELEAIDWYQQRADACNDADLKQILLHNKEEEMEHAMMGIEWIRRRSANFNEKANTYLFTAGPITAIEAAAEGKGGSEGEKKELKNPTAADSRGALGIGSLKGRGA